MDDSNVRVQADNLNLSRPVFVEGLVAVAVLAVQVLGDGQRPQVNSSTKFHELFSLDSSLQDPHVIQDDLLRLGDLELLLLCQALVVGDRVDAVGQGSWAPSVQLLVVHSLGRLDEVLQNLHVQLFDEWWDCHNALALGLCMKN